MSYAVIDSKTVSDLQKLKGEERLVAIELARCLAGWKGRKHWIENHAIIEDDKTGAEMTVRECGGMKPGQRMARSLSWHQRYIWKCPERTIIDKSRQQGLSSDTAVNLYFDVKNFGHSAAVIADDLDSAEYIFEKFTRCHANDLLQKPELKLGNVRQMMFKNRPGRVEVGTAGTPHALRSRTLTEVFGSEVAYWGEDGPTLHKNVMKFVKQKPGTAVIYESTANMEDPIFYPTWLNAIKYCKLVFTEDPNSPFGYHIERTIDDHDGEWNGFHPLFISVLVDPTASTDCSQSEAVEILTTITEEEESLLEEHEVNMNFLKWRRHTISKECMGDLDNFHQEYPCLTGDTRVGTDRGIIPISNIGIGDWTDSGAVLNFWNQGKKEVFKVTTEHGIEIRSTANHLFSVLHGSVWKPLSSLEVGDSLTIIPPRFASNLYKITWNNFSTVQSSIEVTEEWGRFVGYFMGDGCYSSGALSFACNSTDTDVVEDIQDLIKSLLGLSPKPRKSSKGCVEVRANSVALKDVLCKMGLLHRKGKENRAWRHVHVPEFIFKSPENVVKEFLKGLFEADGFNGYKSPRVVLFSKHRDFLKDVQTLLLGFGVPSKLRDCLQKKVNRKTGRACEYTGHTLDLRVSEAVAFNERIGFISNRKKSRVESWKERHASKGRPHRILERPLQSCVVSIVPDGIETVYDIETALGMFSANGLLVHNCTWQQSFISPGRARFDAAKLDLMKIEDGSTGRLVMNNSWSRQIKFEDDPRGMLTVFRSPEPGHRYVMGIDPSEGIESENPHCPYCSGKSDEASIQVYDIDAYGKIEQAATICGAYNEEELREPALILAEWYHMAYVVIENVGGFGEHLIFGFEEGYDPSRLYREDGKDKAGLKVHHGNRMDLVADIGTALNGGQLSIHSARTVHQLKQVKKITPRRAEAGKGHHDDEMSSLWAVLRGFKYYPRGMDPIERHQQLVRNRQQEFKQVVDESGVGAVIGGNPNPGSYY